MIFVDSNIPMYLVGAAHPNKDAARRLLERAIIDGEPLMTDGHVLQEILHRYVAINRRDAIGPASTRCSASWTPSCRSSSKMRNAPARS